MPAIELTIIPNKAILNKTLPALPYQHLHIRITNPQGLIQATDLKGLALPKDIIWSQGIVLEGRAPIWLYGYLVHACHAAAWVACFDPRLGNDKPRSGGAVVVASHTHQVETGQVLNVEIPDRLDST